FHAVRGWVDAQPAARHFAFTPCLHIAARDQFSARDGSIGGCRGMGWRWSIFGHPRPKTAAQNVFAANLCSDISLSDCPDDVKTTAAADHAAPIDRVRIERVTAA